ncbi:MAG: hypothetical protein US42_C0008G0060 [Candidatus Magasanikbacteria bacterium GW2011_GWC2_37_14]|uniref:Uncharacterized protein n=1 Tax=Candidatus Magasanikbacteria bacterium GW2011_GWC2_37_14 TaxID=1619046 RepID=A0A0G0ITP8_9BACT|nr:MAG: hypothetical protein US42_C0008G0060 [Candidatus Magasanikbacteria bacterium GW2011_GWC2_37_14]
MPKNKFLLIFSIIFLVSLFFGLKEVEAVDYQCCVFTHGGISECALDDPCPATKQVVVGSEETGMSGYKTVTENAIGKAQSCTDVDICLKPAFEVTWTDGPKQELTVGEVIKAQTEAKVIFRRTSQPVDVVLSCTNCDVEVTTVLVTGNIIQFTLDTGKFLNKNKGINPYYEIVAKLNDKELGRHTLNLELKRFECKNYKPPCTDNSQCFPFGADCFSKIDDTICRKLDSRPDLCGQQADGPTLGSTACFWDATTKQCKTGMEKGISNKYPVPDGYAEGGGVLPPCAFSGSCRKVNDLLELIINLGRANFGIIGTFAFVFFIYGGFTMITSFGSAEKVKKGRDILLAAVVGMIIAFSAYLLINFIISALGVADSFKVI